MKVESNEVENYELETVTRELILEKIEEVRANIQTKEMWITKREKQFQQMEAIEIDVLKGVKKRYETMLINNHFEEIN